MYQLWQRRRKISRNILDPLSIQSQIVTYGFQFNTFICWVTLLNIFKQCEINRHTQRSFIGIELQISECDSMEWAIDRRLTVWKFDLPFYWRSPLRQTVIGSIQFILQPGNLTMRLNWIVNSHIEIKYASIDHHSSTSNWIWNPMRISMTSAYEWQMISNINSWIN